MSQISNVADINFSTAFETDKVCATLTGSYNAASYSSVLGGYLYQYVIPHSFTRPVFCQALFSSDGNTYIPNGQSSATVTSNIYSDASNLYLLSTYNTGTIYYRIVCTWINNYDGSNPLITPVFETLGAVQTTTFDSRQNYQKLLYNAEITLNNPGTGNTGTTTIAHNLGETPNFHIFFESLPGQIWPSIGLGQGVWQYNFTNQYAITGVADTTNLYLTYNGGSSSPANFRTWYKVYYDS